MPDNWKTFADGHLATHMYRLIDTANGLDLRDPPLSAAMEGKLVPGPLGVDFNDLVVKQQAMTQIHKPDEKDTLENRPFLSCSFDIGQVMEFALKWVWVRIGSGTMGMQIVRIDIIAAFFDGELIFT